MDQATLVTEHIEAGRTLLRELDARGVPVTAAYWFLSFDQQSWQLVISSPKLDEDATFAVHTIVNDIIRGMQVPPIIAPLEPYLIGERAPIVVNLRAFAPTGDALSIRERRIAGESLGNSFILGAYIYRVKQLIPETGVMPVTFGTRFKSGWRVNSGSLEFKDGRLIDLRTDDPAFRDVSIQPKSHTDGLSTSFRTVERLPTNGRKERTLLWRWQFAKGKLVDVDETIDPLPLNQRPDLLQKSG